MPVRLYVGNLPKEPIERQVLQEVFAEVGESVTTKVIKDRKTGKCRGFAFVTVPTDEMADQFIEKFNGQSFMDSQLKIEKALPRTKGKEGKEGAESEEGTGETPPVVTAAPTPKPKPVEKTEGGTAATPKTFKKGSKKKNRSQNNNNVATGNYQTDNFQPDPRWASQLAELRDLLAAQANNT